MNYSELASRMLKAADAMEGDTLKVVASGREYQGILMPHHEFSDPDVLVLKMKSGYNVGVRLDGSSAVEVISHAERKEKPARRQKNESGLKTVAVIGTGGTIASYVDYRTGAVHPALSADDLLGAVPEISSICNVKARVLFSIFSENMDVKAWVTLAQAVREELDKGVDGVIIPHGTDTMGYTSAALSFMLEGVERPVVLVGAQRSSDRPSSDAYTNLIAAGRFCVECAMPGVFVLMHETSSDTTAAVHLGTKVRKMHTSRRDAFASINSRPVARVHFNGAIEVLQNVAKENREHYLKDNMEENVALLQFYPGMDPRTFLPLMKAHKGIVIAGSGLGHVSSSMVEAVREATASGTIVVMASQCYYGRVNLNVYATGRDLINAGAISAEDMIPETALVKLMWVLGQTDDRKKVEGMMTADLRGEIAERRDVDD
ncbi:MAG: Glutamyl-tRNA(Gln) amidotransferase subunit D [Methanomassiliicoccales archaeon PtaU1.Bin124]|nr:MAG: Glutamyl-tRNA(Gln) amidotransferase subunit D [Methanomassiliicoccales archaeon PtaU1.Bin124]